MATVYQGGQSMPAVGTAAYTAAQNAPTTTTGNGTQVNVPNLPASTAGYSYNSQNNTFNAPTTNGGPIASTFSATGQQQSVPSPYAVVTSADASKNLSNINDFYNNTNAAVTTQAQNNTATATANAQVPVISGYTNVSPTKTGNPGEISVSQNGQTYYATPVAPQSTGPTTDQIVSALSGSTGGITPPTPPSPVNPSQVTVPNPSGIDINAENAGYTGALGTQANNLQAAYNNYSQLANQMINGTFPLSGAQQSLVNATSDAFDSMMSNEQLKAGALSSEIGGVSNKIGSAMGDFQNIQTAKAGALANMEIGFQKQDFSMITDAYNAYTTSEQAQTALITDMHNTVVTAYQNGIANYQAQQKFQADQAQQTFTDSMATANFSLTQTQDVINNNLTKAQDAFNNMIAQGQLSLAQQKQYQDEINQKTSNAIAAYNAGLSSGGTFNQSTGTFTATNGTTSTPPGYQALPNGSGIVQHPNGDTYFVNSDGSLTKFQSGTDAQNFVTHATAGANLNQMQQLYNFATSNQGNYGNAQQVVKDSAQYASLYNSLPADLQKIIPATVGGSFNNLSADNAKFTSAYNTIGSTLKGYMPSYTAPTYGTTFTTPQSAQQYFTSTGQTSAYTQTVARANALANKEFGRPANDGEILQMFNGS